MPDQVDWRALEREASPGRAVGRLLRDQREARGLGLAEVEKSLRIAIQISKPSRKVASTSCPAPPTSRLSCAPMQRMSASIPRRS